MTWNESQFSSLIASGSSDRSFLSFGLAPSLNDIRGPPCSALPDLQTHRGVLDFRTVGVGNRYRKTVAAWAVRPGTYFADPSKASSSAPPSLSIPLWCDVADWRQRQQKESPKAFGRYWGADLEDQVAFQ